MVSLLKNILRIDYNRIMHRAEKQKLLPLICELKDRQRITGRDMIGSFYKNFLICLKCTTEEYEDVRNQKMSDFLPIICQPVEISPVKTINDD